MTTYYTTCPSPIEDLLLTAADDHLTGLYMAIRRYEPEQQESWRSAPEHPVLREAVRQLQAYFAGELYAFDLPLRMEGTEFQQSVWRQLREIPYGATISYGELARQIGRPSASRAVGLANGRNPISIVVPCHRVIGSGGSLVGYGGGLARKVALLQHETRWSGVPGQLRLA